MILSRKLARRRMMMWSKQNTPEAGETVKHYVFKEGESALRTDYYGVGTNTFTRSNVSEGKIVLTPELMVPDNRDDFFINSKIVIPADFSKYINLNVECYHDGKISFVGKDEILVGYGADKTFIVSESYENNTKTVYKFEDFTNIENGQIIISYVRDIDNPKRGTSSSFYITNIWFETKEEPGAQEPENPTEPAQYDVIVNTGNFTFDGESTATEETDYTAEIFAAKGYEISSVVATINGNAVGSYADGVLTIPKENITGDIVIEVVATEADNGNSGTGEDNNTNVTEKLYIFDSARTDNFLFGHFDYYSAKAKRRWEYQVDWDERYYISDYDNNDPCKIKLFAYSPNATVETGSNATSTLAVRPNGVSTDGYFNNRAITIDEVKYDEMEYMIPLGAYKLCVNAYCTDTGAAATISYGAASLEVNSTEATTYKLDIDFDPTTYIWFSSVRGCEFFVITDIWLEKSSSEGEESNDSTKLWVYKEGQPEDALLNGEIASASTSGAAGVSKRGYAFGDDALWIGPDTTTKQNLGYTYIDIGGIDFSEYQSLVIDYECVNFDSSNIERLLIGYGTKAGFGENSVNNYATEEDLNYSRGKCCFNIADLPKDNYYIKLSTDYARLSETQGIKVYNIWLEKSSTESGEADSGNSGTTKPTYYDITCQITNGVTLQIDGKALDNDEAYSVLKGETHSGIVSTLDQYSFYEFAIYQDGEDITSQCNVIKQKDSIEFIIDNIQGTIVIIAYAEFIESTNNKIMLFDSTREDNFLFGEYAYTMSSGSTTDLSSAWPCSGTSNSANEIVLDSLESTGFFGTDYKNEELEIYPNNVAGEWSGTNYSEDTFFANNVVYENYSAGELGFGIPGTTGTLCIKAYVTQSSSNTPTMSYLLGDNVYATTQINSTEATIYSMDIEFVSGAQIVLSAADGCGELVVTDIWFENVTL